MNVMTRRRWMVVAGRLLLLAAVGAWVFIAATRNPVSLTDEEKALETVRKLGGTWTVDEKAPGRPVVSVSFFDSRVTDDGLKELKNLKGLQELTLWGTAITDDG